MGCVGEARLFGAAAHWASACEKKTGGRSSASRVYVDLIKPYFLLSSRPHYDSGYLVLLRLRHWGFRDFFWGIFRNKSDHGAQRKRAKLNAAAADEASRATASDEVNHTIFRAKYRGSPHLRNSQFLNGKGSDLPLVSYFKKSSQLLDLPTFKKLPH